MVYSKMKRVAAAMSSALVAAASDAVDGINSDLVYIHPNCQRGDIIQAIYAPTGNELEAEIVDVEENEEGHRLWFRVKWPDAPDACKPLGHGDYCIVLIRQTFAHDKEKDKWESCSIDLAEEEQIREYDEEVYSESDGAADIGQDDEWFLPLIVQEFFRILDKKSKFCSLRSQNFGFLSKIRNFYLTTDHHRDGCHAGHSFFHSNCGQEFAKGSTLWKDAQRPGN